VHLGGGLPDRRRRPSTGSQSHMGLRAWRQVVNLQRKIDLATGSVMPTLGADQTRAGPFRRHSSRLHGVFPADSWRGLQLSFRGRRGLPMPETGGGLGLGRAAASWRRGGISWRMASLNGGLSWPVDVCLAAISGSGTMRLVSVRVSPRLSAAHNSPAAGGRRSHTYSVVRRRVGHKRVRRRRRGLTFTPGGPTERRKCGEKGGIRKLMRGPDKARPAHHFTGYPFHRRVSGSQDAAPRQEQQPTETLAT